MASGSAGSARRASSNQAANSRNGSSASAKSPVVNQLGCLIETVSDILRSGFVAGVGAASASRRVGYNGSVRSRIWRRLLPAAALLIAVPAGACSYQLGSLSGHDSAEVDKTVDKSEVTGSVASTTRSPAPVAEAASDGDLDYARAAAAQALAADDKSLPWENPRTGAR